MIEQDILLDIERRSYERRVMMCIEENATYNLKLLRYSNPGFSYNFMNEDRNTPLHVASEKEERLGIARVLLSGSASLLARNKDGETPLHIVSKKGFYHFAELYIENGADLSQQDNLGRTPAHSALLAGKLDVLKLLVSKGADLSLEDNEGLSVLDYAAKPEHKDAFKAIYEAKTQKGCLASFVSFALPFGLVCTMSGYMLHGCLNDKPQQNNAIPYPQNQPVMRVQTQNNVCPNAVHFQYYQPKQRVQ